MVRSVVIEDHPPRLASCDFHSHLILLLHCSPLAAALTKDKASLDRFKWVPGSEALWRERTSNADFLDGLNNIVMDHTLTTDALNTQVENYLLG